jgi:Tol biopolymer transport system component/PKD repeat protein
MTNVHSSLPRTILVLLLAGFILTLWIPVQATEAEVTPSPTYSFATREVAPTAEEPVRATVTNTPLPPEATSTATPVPPTAAPTATERPPRILQTYCQMNIDDAGDENAFTYQFSAVNANNIDSFEWQFGDSTSAATAAASHTYTTTGIFNIVLKCTPKAGFGSPIILYGSITVASSPIADFDLTPSNIFTGLPPFTVSAVNMSEGSGLVYAWKISTSVDPMNAAAVIYSSAAKDITYTFTAAEIPAYPATFYFHLTVTDGSGLSGYMVRSVVFNAPPPKATFKLSPTSGSAPLTATVEGVDLLEGPLTVWEWDFNADNVVDATGKGPHTYTYNTPGVYPIKLNYSGAGGGGTVTKSVGVFPPADPVKSLFTYELMGSKLGGIQVCFTNNSTGPIAVSKWDFDGNGTYDLTSSDKIVCHIYPAEGNVTVKLSVENADASSTSTSSQSVNVVAEPVASFTVNPGTDITWGTKINLTDTSTGIITQWEWDLNGDGVTDSTTQNITNLLLTQLGANPIRLTVTGPGGKSFVEAIIIVKRLELTCAYTGSLNVLPGAGAQTYTSNVGNQGGRPITYRWTITGNGTGLPMTFTTQNITVDWGAVGYGAFQVTLEAATDDGSTCSESKTVTRAWTALDCKMTNTLPTTVYADGKNYVFTANVQNLNGRTILGYEWYVDGVLQAGATGNTFTYTNTTSTAGLPKITAVRYRVIVDNGAGYAPATSECFDEKQFTVSPWPTLTCTSISGNVTPLPSTPDNIGRNYNYTANVGGLGGRTAVYTWTVSDGTITTPNPRTNNNGSTVIWNGTAGSLPPVPANDSIGVSVTVTNPDGTTETCNMNRAISVTINNLVCNAPLGDFNPVVNESVTYSTSIQNGYGRPPTSLVWEIEQLNPVTGAWTDTSNPLLMTFPTADAEYRIRYAHSVGAAGGLPGDSCISPWQTIKVYGDGLNFECEGNLTGSAAPNNPGSTYAYSIDMDNGNLLNLQYQWTLTDYTGTDYPLATITSAANGIISSPAFTLAQLAPLFADNYTLRVNVTAVDTALSTYTCSKSLPLTVGTLNVNFTYNAGGWTNTAVPVNQPICLTNTSSTVPGSINNLNYTWTVGGNAADNSWGSSTSSEQQPSSCISFSKPGAYTIDLKGTTFSGLRSANKTITFTVYGLQSILIQRAGSNFAPSTQTFTATGTNITGAYNWEFRRVADNALLGNRVGATVTFPFAADGQFRALVTGTGPLGTTSASLDFNLLSAGGLSAAFVASQYGGIAPMNVCFTDNSVSGSPIILWEWDFDGDGAFDLTYDDTNIPANICHNYDVPSMVYPVSLRVTNVNFVDTATNTIRTYSELESSATFAVQPQGGGYFCFDGIVTPDVVITGWDFGDETTGPGNDPICHTYGASGTYVVTMKIISGTQTGEVTRVIVVDLTGGTPPQLTADSVCSPDVKATFTITNTGGAMKTPDQVIIHDEDGNVILIAPLQLAAGGSATFTVSGYVGNVTLSTTDIVLTATTDCAQPPLLSGVSVCQADGTAVFTITNTSTETAASQPYEIRDASNTLIDSGTLNVPVGGSTDIKVSNIWGQLTLTSSGIQGETTVLNISSNCDTPPLLKISHTCQIDGTAVFTITNDSPDTAADQPYEIRDANNNLVKSGILTVAPQDSTEISVQGVYGALTFTSSGTQGATTVLTDTSDCDEPPMLGGSADCALDGTATFIIENTSPDTDASQPYEVRDHSNTLIDSGTLNVPAGGSTMVKITGVYTALTLTTSGVQGATTELSIETNCDEPPVLSVTSTCQIDGTAVFTVTNTSLESAADQPYEIRDAGNTLIQSGTLTVGTNSSTDITVSNVYGLLTFSSKGMQGVTTEISATSDCAEPPMLSGSADCALDGTATFTITNASQNTAADQPYEVRDASNTLIDSGTLNVPTGGSTTVTISGVYTALTLTSSGVQGATTVLNVQADCAEPPILSVTSTCRIDGTAVFTITNTSLESAADQPYEIRDASNTLVESGVLNVPVNSTASVTVENVYGLLTFSSTGTQGTITATSDCAEPVHLTGSATCESGTAIFVIENQSSTPANQPYSVTNGSGGVVQSGTLEIAGKSAQTITVEGMSGQALSFQTEGMDSLTLSAVCGITGTSAPSLSGSSVCLSDGSVSFTVNNEGQQSINQTYQVLDVTGTMVSTGTLNLKSGQSTTITVAQSGVTFVTDGMASLSLTAECANDGDHVGVSDVTHHLPKIDLTPRLPDATFVPRPEWESISMGGAVCTEWLIYHTNMTGDWEIFRLGDGGEARLAQADPNLSQGRGENVTDMSPTRSPDGEWIAFTSNRDHPDNWELYLASVDNTVIRRMTYNTIARDIDPAWSPDGRYVAFETDRDGNWELYLFDLATGAEIRLSDDESSDINPFWSPDSQQIAFQSDRTGMWQIYLMDVATHEVTRLSDGNTEDHDPHLSFDGKQIAFRAYTDNTSGIYLMNIDGSEKTLISDKAGSASNHTWSPDDQLIAYQSNLDGDLDVYVYELETGRTRLVTDNTIPDYAPTWLCDARTVVFTSDVLVDANIFNTPAVPMEAKPILVNEEATQMTFDPKQDVYPENTPSEENASREGNVPPKIDSPELVLEQ